MSSDKSIPSVTNTKYDKSVPLKLRYDDMIWRGICEQVYDPNYPNDESKAKWESRERINCYNCGGVRKGHTSCGIVYGKIVELEYQPKTCGCDEFMDANMVVELHVMVFRCVTEAFVEF